MGAQAWPLLEVLLKPCSPADRDVLTDLLSGLLAEDFSLGCAPERAGHIILQGIEETRLAAAVERLREGAAIEAAQPRVAYREAILRRVDLDTTHKRRFGTRGEFARVKMTFEPGAAGYASAVADGAVPANYLSAVETSIGAVMRTGVLAGFPLVETRAVLLDGAYHDRDSSARTFATVARAALTEAMDRAGGVVEPAMRVEVVAPRELAGAIRDDFVRRRGQVVGHVAGEVVGQDRATIEAIAPLSRLIGYGGSLHALSDGRAEHRLRFEAYRPVAGDGDPPPPGLAAGMRA